jgi:ABC-2 type transport system permease protein
MRSEHTAGDSIGVLRNEPGGRHAPRVAFTDKSCRSGFHVLAPVTEVWNHRSIVMNLTQRELKAKYKKSVLGWLWSLLNPASTLLIYSVVFGVFLKVVPPVAGNGELKNYAVYLFTALVVWNFFNAAVVGSMEGMVGAGPLIRKVYLPPECIPLSVVLAAVLQTVIEAGLLVAVMIAVGNVSLTFLLFPVLLVLLMLFSTGVGLVVAMMNVYYRDVRYLVTIALLFLFYATPIIYTIDLIPEEHWGLPMRDIVEANPLTQFVEAARSIFYLLEVPALDTWAYLVAVAVGSLALGWWLFARRSAELAEEL